MVKGAVFNILGDIEGLLFLDLFAGTGQMGIEAMKRGARVIFVERNPRLAKDIRERTRAKVMVGDALKVLHRIGDRPDIVFADPPYSYNMYGKLIEEVLELLSPGGVFILEHDKRKDFGAPEVRRYGDTHLSLWRKPC